MADNMLENNVFNQMYGQQNIPMLQQDDWDCLKNIIATKRILRSSLLLQLKKKLMQPTIISHCPKVCERMISNVAGPTASPMPTYYSYPQEYSSPISVSDWPMQCNQQPSLISIQTLPIIVPNPTPIFTTPCPYTGTIVQPILSPMVQQYTPEDLTLFTYNTDQRLTYAEPSFCTELIEDVTKPSGPTYYVTGDNLSKTNQNIAVNETGNLEINNTDHLESYLRLPKEMFPPARLFPLDPNAMIDEFCKMSNLQRHIPWLLDLEFGIPKSPITRPIPTYNVKFNSIHCKNAPDAIHPGFESCEPDFKRVLLFYYDCIVSAWYKGYVGMTDDRSVENFQSWLLLPMQVLGMCWP